MTSRSLGHRAPLLWLALPLMAGLIAGRAGEIAAVAWLLGGALGLACIALASADRAPQLWRLAIAGAMFLAGNASYALHRARLPDWETLPPREARLTLQVERVFAPRDARRTTGLARVTGTEPHLRDLIGQRLYYSLALPAGEAAPIRSAALQATGVLTMLPRDPPADSFDGYLASAGMNFRLARGRLEATAAPALGYYRFCARAADRFAAILSLGVGDKRPELAGVLRAMMLGQKHELSDEQGTLFMRSGTMHLFAISGLHIGVIAGGIHALLLLLRLPKTVRFAVSLAALWLYVDITGAAPSAVRAFIMVALVECSMVLRAPDNPLSALATSALIVLLAWPMQLFSASFQMSYAIVAALLLLGLPLADAWQERWKLFRDLPKATWSRHHHAFDWLHRKLVAAVALGLAATLISTLYGVWYFKLFTPASLLANLILIPLSMVVIWAGLASLVGGLAGATWLSELFNHAAVLTLWGIDACVRVFVAIPGGWAAARFAWPSLGMVSVALVLGLMLLGYGAGWRKERGSWWPPFAITVLVMLVGVSFG